MPEYVQTEQDRWLREDSRSHPSHTVLKPPSGDGWTLHSWQPSPQNSTKLLMVWQRDTPPAPR